MAVRVAVESPGEKGEGMEGWRDGGMGVDPEIGGGFEVGLLQGIGDLQSKVSIRHPSFCLYVC